MMPRILKNPAKIAFYFCTLFSLSPWLAFAQPVDTAWVRRYNGPGNGDDKAVALAVDSGGNVYVTGSSFDSATGYDFATIKYLPNGDTGWVRRYDGLEGQNDFAVALALDKAGNIYATGTEATPLCMGGSGSSDMVTIKYFPDGSTAWVRSTYGAACERFDISTLGLALDGQGNVYVEGRAFHLLIGSFGLTIKYDSEGNVLWNVLRWSNSGPSNATVPIAVDSTGSSICVIGNDSTFKYDSLGNEIWVRSFPGTPRAIALDNGSNVYVVGNSAYDFVVVKYGSSGDSLWVKRSNAVPDWYTFGASLVATDKFDNVYLMGTYFAFPDFIAWLTLKYDSAGNEKWVRSYGGGDGSYREPKAMVLDTSGNVYVAGQDAWYGTTIKYDQQGNLLWEKKYSDSVYGVENHDLAINQKGNIFVAGSIGNDFLTIKYSPLPQLRGDLNRDGMLNLFDIVLALNCVFLGEAPPDVPPSACDMDCDGLLTASDVVILLNAAFLSVPPPC